MSFVEHSAYRRLAYYLGSAEFFSRHDDNNFSSEDNKRYLRSVSSLRAHLRVLQREPKVDAGVFGQAVKLMDDIHALMPRLLKQAGTEAGLECLASMEEHVTELGRLTAQAGPGKPSGVVLPSWESFSEQQKARVAAMESGTDAARGQPGMPEWPEARGRAGAGRTGGQTPDTPGSGYSAPEGGLTAASFLDSDDFAAAAQRKRQAAAAARAQSGQAASVPPSPQSGEQQAGKAPRSGGAMGKNAAEDVEPAGPEELSPETIALCAEHFAASASRHGRAAKIWAVLAFAGAMVFCYFFYLASFNLDLAAGMLAGSGHEGLLFADLLLTKTFVFLPWFCCILLCIRSCWMERERRNRILQRMESLDLYTSLGSGLDRRGRSKILSGIIAPER